MDSPFEILEVDEDASDAAVERAYRRRVKEAHPDHGGSAEEFQRVRSAYEAIQSGYRPELRDFGGRPGRKSGDDGRGADPAPESGSGGRNGREGGTEDDGARGGDSADEADGENGDEDGDGSGDSEPDAGADAEPDGFRVEYLNYEAIDDRGWDLGDDDLFEKASAAGLDPADYGKLLVQPRETLLEAAENRGFAWPFACRGGACANCAVAVVEGEMGMPANHILPPEMTDSGIRLSCISAPVSANLKVVYNVKHLPSLDELRLPPQQFGQARADD